jgi:hypothetical protein
MLTAVRATVTEVPDRIKEADNESEQDYGEAGAAAKKINSNYSC